MKSIRIHCILLFLIVFQSIGFAQDFRLRSKEEKIVVRQDSSFVKEITIAFEASEKPRLYPIFYDTELERVSDIQLFEKKRKRLKKLPLQRTYDEDVELDYITSKKIKIIQIPEGEHIELKYKISCTELMYFTRLHFFSYNEIDTLFYKVVVPKEFKLVHDTAHRDSLSFFTIDSTKTDIASEWNIKVAPKKVAADPLQLFGIYKNMKVPFMRTLVVPISYKGEATDYMNDWYIQNAASRKGLSASVMEKIDELTAGETDQLKIINIIYNYVRSNFKYVAIEVGMGAFIPSAADEVFENKYGDCKDLSNFLSEALKYKGIESDIALAATFDHISDCDFPTLSSANHVIGVAYVDGKTILLDPTDPIHYEGSPVQSLQNRTILIVNPKGGTFYKVTPFSPQQNEIFYQLKLKVDSNSMLVTGDFSIDYQGITSNFLKGFLKIEGEKEFDNFGKTLYEEIFGNQSISNLKVTNETKKVHIDGDISINGKTFNDGTSTYLFIDFLPRLFEIESRETLIEGTYIRSPFYKKMRATLQMDAPIVAFEPIEHTYQGEGMSLKMTIKAISNLEIECNYDFVFDHIFINKENSNSTNEILKSFKKIINEPIVLKKQKS
ncbi:transglutaminase-like superfamily protein [Kordia sp. SMS9]|uniref:transglutaminase-like domain-containing protein n=1 Tax=Kordia sp. SMS9 TaxID=2282170 RepID=UPI000E0D3BD0|nr:transglutaminase-like domain-containing protein [Kordia sp. SMS9]AXG71006.1 transglutaminase-like superfamily protein [Kordia sp. SMS9]